MTPYGVLCYALLLIRSLGPNNAAAFTSGLQFDTCFFTTLAPAGCQKKNPGGRKLPSLVLALSLARHDRSALFFPTTRSHTTTNVYQSVNQQSYYC